MRMSSGPSLLMEKPRWAVSNCIEEAPRSNRTPSTVPSLISCIARWWCISENFPSTGITVESLEMKEKSGWWKNRHSYRIQSQGPWACHQLQLGRDSTHTHACTHTHTHSHPHTHNTNLHTRTNLDCHLRSWKTSPTHSLNLQLKHDRSVPNHHKAGYKF